MALRPARSALLAIIAASALAGLSTGASAATARASGTVIIRSGPGYAYPVIGRLAGDETVSLSECTPSGTWCRIVHKGPSGWVLGSYLVGSAAKVQATPWKPLVNPFAQPYRRRGLFGR